MINVAELPSSIPNFRLLDNIAGGRPSVHDRVMLLALLIYLRWADFQEAELEAIAAFDDTPYEPVLPASLHWRFWHQLPANELFLILTRLLPDALYQLNNCRHNAFATNLHRLAGPLQNLTGIPAKSIAGRVGWLAEQPFETPSDRHKLLNAFDNYLEAAKDKDTGEFKTPPHIARFMVELAAPSIGEHIYDPCFGSASLLTTAIDHVLHNTEQKTVRYDAVGLKVSGVELHESAFIIGLTRVVLAGNDDPHLEYGNSLERTPPVNLQQEGFDVVVANPPWGWKAKMDNRNGLEQYSVMTTDSTGLFIQHALSNLRPNGRAVIAVPNAILFRGGAERRLREWLIRQHTVEVVISLPETAFLPFTSLKSSILVLKSGGTTKQIRMVDADLFFEQGKGRQSAEISDSQLHKLIEKIRAPNPSDCCWDVEAVTLAETEFDFTPKRRNQGNLVVILEAIRSEVPLVQLKDCCQIMIGRSLRSADLVAKPPRHSQSVGQQSLLVDTWAVSKQQDLFSAVEPIPFVRIKDIKKGQANKGSSWISAEAAVRVEGKWKLRAGDVLLSKSGTIGKVGIVRNGAVGAIASNGLYILRVDGARLDPHYLAAYLDSGDCRDWLMDRATSGGISHLRKHIIEEIPVPLPPQQIQQRVAEEYREHGVDVLAYLTQLLTGGERDPVAEWVEKELKRLSIAVDSVTDPLNFTLLDELASNVGSLRNEPTGSSDASLLAPWFLAFKEAVFNLRGVGKIPQSPGLLSVLQESGRVLKQAEVAIKGNLPIEGKARTLTGIVSKWLAKSCSKLLDTVQIILSADTATLYAGEAAEIDLKVRNLGPLPLRDIAASTTPDWGHGELDYLAENASTEFSLRALVPKMVGPLILTVHWSALTLDGRQVEGAREIPFEVLPGVSKTEAELTGLGGSPYVCGDPIRPERNDVFFGREDLLDQIRRQIVQSGNVVLLEGNRRAGKSSILRHLEGTGFIPGWLGIYCSLQGAEGSREGVGVPTVAIFREMASSIAKGLITLGIATPLPDGSVLKAGKKTGIARVCREGISEDSPFTDFRDYAEAALDAIADRKLGILLMLDEFDKLQEGIDNGVTSPQVPENIRFLVQTYPRFSAILTGSRRLKRLRESYWSALYGLGTRFGVTSLPHAAALRLVTEPVKGRLTYSKEAAERAISLTDRQPYLLQCFCNRIFDMAAQLKIRSVTVDLVDKAGDMLAENNEHFASLWDYAHSDRRRFILTLCHKEAGGPDSLRFGVILELLSRHGIELNDDTLIADLEFLQELELIKLVGESGNGHYTLSIPLMGRWIDRQHDFVVLQKKARMETEDQDA